MTAAPRLRTEFTDVVTMGETMALLRSAAIGPLAHQSTLNLSVGGAESNLAIALTRLGTSVSWVGRVGADSLGDLVLRELRAEGVKVVATVDPASTTGLMIKERRTADNVKVWYHRAGSAGSRLCPADVPRELIAATRVLHVTGITVGISATALQAVNFAIDCALEAGALVSFDFNYRSALWPPAEAGKAFLSIAKRADLVFAGADEAALVVGDASPREQAARLSALGPRHVAIKLGAHGAVALIDGKHLEQPAISVSVVDTVGAGDAFVAGYLSDFLAGASPAACLRTAALAGAFVCTVDGDWEGSPRRDEFELLANAEGVSR